MFIAVQTARVCPPPQHHISLDIPNFKVDVWPRIFSQGMESSCICMLRLLRYASNVVDGHAHLQVPCCTGPSCGCSCRQNIMCNFPYSPKSVMYVAVTAGDGKHGYRAVIAGIVESAQSIGHLKGHLLQRLPTLMEISSNLEVILRLGTSYVTLLQHGCSHLMVSDQGCISCVALLPAFAPAACIPVHCQSGAYTLLHM